jgi:hypothetical protein
VLTCAHRAPLLQLGMQRAWGAGWAWSAWWGRHAEQAKLPVPLGLARHSLAAAGERNHAGHLFPEDPPLPPQFWLPFLSSCICCPRVF